MEIDSKMVRPSKVRFMTSWTDVKGSAMTTINKEGSDKEPTDLWISKILMAEHSPIRNYLVNFKWDAVPYWVAMHFVRHHEGVQWFVGTQREDRGGSDRSQVPQTALVPLEGYANAQALINISRKRLCYQASPETRRYWQGLKDEIKKLQPELAKKMVSECIYRGFCPEYHTCGYVHCSTFRQLRGIYVKGFKDRTDGMTTDPVTGERFCDYMIKNMNKNKRRIYDKHKNQVSQSDDSEN